MERNGKTTMYALQNLISKKVLAARQTADISNKQLRSNEISDVTFFIRTLITRERQRSSKNRSVRGSVRKFYSRYTRTIASAILRKNN